MNFNLYPYNYWLLYVAIIITVIVFFLNVPKAINFLKTLSNQTDDLLSLANSITNLNEKQNQVSVEVQRFNDTFHKYFSIIFFVFWFSKIYKSSNDKGFKRVNSSVKQAMLRRTTLSNRI